MSATQAIIKDYHLKEFGIFVAKSFAGFMTITLVVVFLHMFGVTSSFVQSWRWYHDTLLIPIFWYIAPIFLIGFLADLVLERFVSFKWLHRLPVAIHEVVVIFFMLGSATIVSQLLGGCIWFYPTEGWWRRFVPPSLPNENTAVALYFVFSIISVWATWAYWRRFVYHSKLADQAKFVQ
jgi:hypothetical protein